METQTTTILDSGLASSASNELRATYPSLSAFAKDYNTDLQLYAIGDTENYVISISPSLLTLTYAYTERGAKAWMLQQINAVLGDWQRSDRDNRLLDELVNILYERFRYERVKVFILFCSKCRSREYKVSYGSIKIDAILDAANEFFKALPRLKQDYADKRDREKPQPNAFYGLDDIGASGDEGLKDYLKTAPPTSWLAWQSFFLEWEYELLPSTREYFKTHYKELYNKYNKL